MVKVDKIRVNESGVKIDTRGEFLPLQFDLAKFRGKLLLLSETRFRIGDRAEVRLLGRKNAGK